LRFTRVLFGLVSSAFLLGGVIDAHLSIWDESEAEVVAKLQNELYVDDLILGSTLVLKAKEIKEKALCIFEDACFKLHKWHSNERELEATEGQDGDPTYAKQQLGMPEGGESSILRLEWNKEQDTVTVKMPTEKMVFTKRGILAKLAKTCDPLGFASPLKLTGKLIYRTCNFRMLLQSCGTSGTVNFQNKWKPRDC
jgi:hypothetical protein